jgi:fructose-1,6-bisphosphatase/inositol monophosphatase family enzyme
MSFLTDPLRSAVSSLLRDVAAGIVLPRYRSLKAGQAIEKSPGEIVTIADLEAEVALYDGLAKLDTFARIIGEEAVERDAELLDGLSNGAVWLVDPVDGTKNFARGSGPFGMMIALVVDGRTEHGWLYCPITDRMCYASRSQGAWINDDRVKARPSGAARPIAALATQFLEPDLRRSVEDKASDTYQLELIPGCAAEHYPRNVLGTYDVSLFQRTFPWDHAAGALFLEEAGGKAARWDGSEYKIGDDGFGLLVAASPQLWDQAAELLFNTNSGLPSRFEGLPLHLAALKPASFEGLALTT